LFIHEDRHLKQNLTADKYSKNGDKYELDAYFIQVTHNTWDKTTDGHKKSTLLNIVDNINGLDSNSEKQYWINKFKPTLNDYGTLSKNANNNYEYNHKATGY